MLLEDCMKLGQSAKEIECDCVRCTCKEEVCICDLGNKCKSVKAKRTKRAKEIEAEKTKNKLEKKTRKFHQPDDDESTPTGETALEQQIYCICNRPYKEDVHKCMIGCDTCPEWYYCHCIRFTCAKCEENNKERAKEKK